MGGGSVDLAVGIGGATAGIMTAVAMRALGGEVQARLWPVSRRQVEEIRALGIADIERRWSTEELAGEETVLAVTAITDCWPLRGIARRSDGVHTETLICCARCGEIRLATTVRPAWEAGARISFLGR
ncbi:MAG: fructose-bisphosphatase class II [Thermoleophilia bacterium]|nr:fructose-bisphosphatase class II [Thermoleophilia bacterium]